MAPARRERRARSPLAISLPKPAETAAAIQKAARHLGLLLDLYRIASRLRDLDGKTPPRSSS
jgi:hypothetical protein